MNELTFALGFLASTILFDVAIFAFIYSPLKPKKAKKQKIVKPIKTN